MKRPFEGGQLESAEEGEIPIQAKTPKLIGEGLSPSIDADADADRKKKEKEPMEDSPPTKVEGVEDSQTQPEKKNTYSCRICTKPGHNFILCPWKKRVPSGVTRVGEGYVIKQWRNLRRAVLMYCEYCSVHTHTLEECPIYNKTGEDVPLPAWAAMFD